MTTQEWVTIGIVPVLMLAVYWFCRNVPVDDWRDPFSRM